MNLQGYGWRAKVFFATGMCNDQAVGIACVLRNQQSNRQAVGLPIGRAQFYTGCGCLQ